MVRDPLIPRLLSTSEAAELLGCSRQYVDKLVKENKLPAAYVGASIVVAEETALRYKAGERFAFPVSLVVHGYDEDDDRWVEQVRKAVPPDYEMPERIRSEEIGVAAGQSYRVELLDNQGKTLAVKTVDAEAVS